MYAFYSRLYCDLRPPAAFLAALAFVGGWLRDRQAVAAVLAAMALFSLVAWLTTGRRYHLIVDTPTSPIQSAGQGYVELVGRAEAYPGDRTLGPLWVPPSLWYRYEVRCSSEATADRGVSSDTFLLADDSGRCIVDPDGAEVIALHHRHRQDGGCVYDIDYIKPGDPLYALGEFVTTGGGYTLLDPEVETRELLKEWKRNPTALKERFDRNGDGEIDMEEWAAARRQAQEEAEQQVLKQHLQPGLNILRVPRDGRLFLLSNTPPEALARRLARWSGFHLAVFVAAAVACLTLLTRLG